MLLKECITTNVLQFRKSSLYVFRPWQLEHWPRRQSHSCSCSLSFIPGVSLCFCFSFSFFPSFSLLLHFLSPFANFCQSINCLCVCLRLLIYLFLPSLFLFLALEHWLCFLLLRCWRFVIATRFRA